MGKSTPDAIQQRLGRRLEQLRLSRNLTQAELARDAGIGERTLRRLETGERPTLDTLIRVMSALGIEQNLDALVPDAGIRPVERVRSRGSERRRARPKKHGTTPAKPWRWAEDD